MTAAAPPLITRWATQEGRAPAAFAPDQAQLDGRDFAELLADIARLARDIPFHNDAGALEGDWGRILLADQSFVRALLATADIDARAGGIEALLHEARRGGTAADNQQRLTRLVDALMAFADGLDEWIGPADLGGDTQGRSIRRLAENAVERVLGPQLQLLFDQVAAAEEAELTDRFREHRERWEGLRRPWHRAMIEGEVRGVAEAVERAWADRMLEQLADAAEDFIAHLRLLSTRAAAALEGDLVSGDHSAHPALVIAFARIFDHVRATLDQVPQALIDFYQQRVLRGVPAPARPDRVLLAIAPKPGAKPVLPKGMLIPAGKDADGRGIAFATDAALEATGATLREARLWRPQAGGATLSVVAGGADGQLGDAGLAAAPLGAPFAAAAIFSSPLLDLPGGTRQIMLRLGFSGTLEDSEAEDVAAWVSSAQGWLLVPGARCALAGAELTVTLTLPTDFPPLSACPAETPDAVAGPALRLVGGAGAFAAVSLVEAALKVAAKDAPGLIVSTPSGPASAAAAAPFGAPPYPGGWLRLDHPALAGPPLDRLVVQFDWAGLPPGETGFAGYYRGYVVDEQGQLLDWCPFDNAAFTVTLAAPVPGWDASRRVPLFAPAEVGTAPPVAAAAAPDMFAEDFEAAPPLMPEQGPLAPSSWLAAAAGAGTSGALPDHVAVTLASPVQGFGHGLHATNVQYATAAMGHADAPPPRTGAIRRLLRAIAQLPGKLLKKLKGGDAAPPLTLPPPALPLLPNPPFQPLLSGIRLDYARTAGAGELALHHAATGLGLAAAPLSGGPLFPEPPQALTLDLVFDGVPAGGVLALLVQLGAGEAGGPPSFSYRAAGAWQPLPPAALLVDETCGLARTGIVRLAVPADARSDGGPGLVLRATFGPEAKLIPPIAAIQADAVGATRLTDGSETAMAPLPAGSIAKLPLPGVARVAQPIESDGGQSPEGAGTLRARMAERIRHRGRGLAGWDIERLVLAEFPAIARVRVLPEADPALAEPSGKVTVVVVPAPGGATPPDPVQPVAPPRLRSAIAERLAALASPFARIEVVDPLWLPLDIDATLVLEGTDPAPVEAALDALLSPWSQPGLDLADHASSDAIRATIANFLLAQPRVVAIDRLSVALSEAPADARWRMPSRGTISVAALAASAVPSW